MYDAQSPKWVRFLERRFSWIAIPNIAILFVTLQAFGFLFTLMDPIWVSRLALVPEAVRNGEYWRLVTFLALPLATSPIWIIFMLWFLYFIIDAIEQNWGAFKTTLYILISISLTIAFSFIFQYPVTQISGFESTLFLAAAALFPEMQVQLFMIVPVKMKWLAWLTLSFILYQLILGNWVDRIYLLSIYSNYLAFFGPAHINRIKQIIRRRKYRSHF
jgi:hypothetical protein